YGDRLDATGQGYLQRVFTATGRMSLLIDGLLDLSRLSRNEIRREPLDLSEMAREVAAGLRSAQPEREMKFVCADGVTAEGDPQLLRVVLENLLGNAWKFTAKRPKATIHFGVTEEGGKKAYFVRDDGAGFDATYADKLFVPFQRLHGSKEFPGTGIGLATVMRIVRRHGGRIWAEGAVEQGATFYFTLQEPIR
ncbi:MAG: ATP-binding protein, partial [Chloroflexi bacterium]|nr:ATP-binding protein [Chloroflexota bacterium]